MKTLKFKTNIKCGGCVATVTPYLNQVGSIEDWQVDTQSPDKILIISGAHVDPQRVINLVQQAGFKAEVLQVAGTTGGDL